MKNMKSIMLGTVAVLSLSANAAFAQSAVSPGLVGSDLHGAGASSVENVVVQAFNCISGSTNAQKLGLGAPKYVAADPAATPPVAGVVGGTLRTVPAGSFTGNTSAANPPFTCANDAGPATANSVQPNFLAKYVSTGSGFGRDIWRSFSNRFTSANNTGANSNSNPFETQLGQAAWTNVQYAFSDSPISSGDLSTHLTNANSSTNKAGAAIQIPLYVLPVAVAYNPQYGTTAAGTKLLFTVPTGGIKMTTAQYCSIFNGNITNFKTISSTLKATGLGAEQAAEDARWAADGVPIRLIGRLDNSGTTNIFTRHLAESNVCGTTANKFSGGANDALPATAFGNGVWTTTPNTTASTFSGTETPGLFSRSTGSSGVRNAINQAPDQATASANGTLLNGKLGYISADFVAPADTNGAVAAQLTQVGSTSAYKLPTAANAATAFATILPPQSTSNGTYSTTDPRKNSDTKLPVNRSNPLDWSNVLYSRADLNGGFTAKTLAAPSVGYPITGTTFLLTSTCFASSANRLALAEFLYINLKKITKNSTDGKVSSSLFSGPSGVLSGTTIKAGLSALSAAWQKATYDTFLVKTTGALGDKGLWIQNKLPTTTLTGITGNTNQPLVGAGNATTGGQTGCTTGAGA